MSSGRCGWTLSVLLSLWASLFAFLFTRLSSEGLGTTGQIPFPAISSGRSGQHGQGLRPDERRPMSTGQHPRRQGQSEPRHFRTLEGRPFSLARGVLGGQWTVVTFNLMCVQRM